MSLLPETVENNFKFHQSMRENPLHLKKYQHNLYESIMTTIEGIDENIGDIIMEYMNAIWGVGDLVLIQFCNQGGSYKRLCTIEARHEDRIFTATTSGRHKQHYSNISKTPQFIWFYKKGIINYNQCWKTKYKDDDNIIPDCSFYVKDVKKDSHHF
eukprot:414629_1